MWRLWKSRNGMVFNRKEEDPIEMLNKSINDTKNGSTVNRSLQIMLLTPQYYLIELEIDGKNHHLVGLNATMMHLIMKEIVPRV